MVQGFKALGIWGLGSRRNFCCSIELLKPRKHHIVEYVHNETAKQEFPRIAGEIFFGCLE